MVSESIELKFVYCTECGSIMKRQTPSKEQTATGTKDIFECEKCGTLMFFGKIITSYTGETLDQFTVAISFNQSTQSLSESAKKEVEA